MAAQAQDKEQSLLKQETLYNKQAQHPISEWCSGKRIQAPMYIKEWQSGTYQAHRQNCELLPFVILNLSYIRNLILTQVLLPWCWVNNAGFLDSVVSEVFAFLSDSS